MRIAGLSSHSCFLSEAFHHDEVKHLPSAEVCLSSQPEIILTTAGIAFSASSRDIVTEGKDYLKYSGIYIDIFFLLPVEQSESNNNDKRKMHSFLPKKRIF